MLHFPPYLIWFRPVAQVVKRSESKSSNFVQNVISIRKSSENRGYKNYLKILDELLIRKYEQFIFFISQTCVPSIGLKLRKSHKRTNFPLYSQTKTLDYH